MAARVRSFFFTHPPTTNIYTLSLHDALPILRPVATSFTGTPTDTGSAVPNATPGVPLSVTVANLQTDRSEEHTSELQSHHDLVCRLLLEKKKQKLTNYISKCHTYATNSSSIN